MKHLLAGIGTLAFVLLLILFVRTPITPLATDAAENPSHYADPAIVVQQYYRALNGGNIPAALDLLPDDVILELEVPPTYGRISYENVVQVQEWLETDHAVLARSVGDIFVQGDMIEYTLTEWLDPRIAGANVPQPRVTHWTARVRNGKLLGLVQDPAVE